MNKLDPNKLIKAYKNLKNKGNNEITGKSKPKPKT